ncbi:hypothetical protein HID58_075820 [Brassica napus]|uniref:Uncharacterized protein n=1 Tax=Brassica napus TaxID=3708 RepID=A0ABQ7YNE4_BRANA|nr:hypothetical protein HID58_075820 [Brassica napus]
MVRPSCRPQRGLPKNSVSVLRVWLFEHFLHPYPEECEKMTLQNRYDCPKTSLHADAVVGRAVGMLMKANDTSTAESGSELEELTSPKTNMNSYVAKLTPVSENANGKKSPTVLFEYEDCVPMVVKVVDVAWESQEMSNASEGYKPLTVDVFER